ncbi:LacI family DNA-binding transcriptional regulator [Opitutus sp. ER46]|uniref:LacI family DNA-binding transcriptional regulator n=1 Tax=Opitutus sp. ER46 TaxID=2161864 RepID=UPI000D31C582|nr:LacI family DNA-binding transcriptional regulator [Opitutus sp. ER46]PTX94513.1 LacI family transcriptional regulator [Opitutus sp. ER46]
MAQHATLQDVADKAGVHRSTVALALRDHPRIPQATRRRIQAIARKIGYRLNPLVAALMRARRTGRPVKHVSLAFVTNYPTRWGWRPENHDRPDFFPGAVQRAKDFGYKLEHFWLAEPGMTPSRFCDILSARAINGLIIGRLPPGQRELQLDWDRFSAVALGLTLRSPLLHHVTENHFETAWTAMDQCAERGYQRVGYVYTDANDSPRVGDRWVSAYLGQQQKLPPARRIPVCPGMPADASGFADWFRQHRPDALLVSHAAPVRKWLDALGHRVPDDVGLIELEDRPDAGCAGVYYDAEKIGALGVELLIGMMHRNETGVPTDPHEVLLSGAWREGVTLPHRTGRVDLTA